LWSPFAGLFVLVLFLAGIGSSGGDRGPHLVSGAIVIVVCWLFWVVGVILGILALCRCRGDGRKGVFGRAVIGMTLNGLFLGLTIWGVAMGLGMWTKVKHQVHENADAEADKARARVGGGAALQKELAAYADRAFGAQVLEVQKKYQASAVALTNPPVLDMAGLKGKEELQARVEAIREFIAASKELQDFCENALDTYRDELSKHKLTPETRDALLNKFVQKVQPVNRVIIALRKADVRRGEAMLKLATFLETNWGKWEYDSEKDRLRFQETKLSDDYSRANQELEKINAETLRLQAEAKNLSNPGATKSIRERRSE
jgi:hypothetical protein